MTLITYVRRTYWMAWWIAWRCPSMYSNLSVSIEGLYINRFWLCSATSPYPEIITEDVAWETERNRDNYKLLMWRYLVCLYRSRLSEWEDCHKCFSYTSKCFWVLLDMWNSTLILLVSLFVSHLCWFLQSVLDMRNKLVTKFPSSSLFIITIFIKRHTHPIYALISSPSRFRRIHVFDTLYEKRTIVVYTNVIARAYKFLGLFWCKTR